MRRLKFIPVALLGVFFSGAVLAQNLVLATQIQLDAFDDDQFDLQTEDSGTRSIVYQPRIQLAYMGQQYQNTLDVGAAYNRFYDSDIENTTNFNADWQTQRNTATSTLSVLAGYNQRLVTDFLEFDDVSATATEVVQTINLGVGYSVNLSELNQLQLDYGYTETTGRNRAADTARTPDAAQQGVAVQWLRTLSPRSNVGIAANYQLYQPEDGGENVIQRADVETIGLAILGAYELNERWNIFGDIGVNQAQLDDAMDVAPGEEAVVGDGDYLLAATLGATYTGLRNVIGLGFNAGTTQQLDGVVDNQRSGSISWNREINERWSSDVSGRYFYAERNDRVNVNLEASLNWQQSERLALRLTYLYRTLDFEELDFDDTDISSGTASNRVTLTLEYSFEDINIRL